MDAPEYTVEEIDNIPYEHIGEEYQQGTWLR